MLALSQWLLQYVSIPCGYQVTQAPNLIAFLSNIYAMEGGTLAEVFKDNDPSFNSKEFLFATD